MGELPVSRQGPDSRAWELAWLRLQAVLPVIKLVIKLLKRGLAGRLLEVP